MFTVNVQTKRMCMEAKAKVVIRTVTNGFTQS